MLKIKVCSFNLRVDAECDGINKFTNREGRVLEVINNESPDLIGFQEAKDFMRDWLRDTLTDYVVLGCGRESDYRGESTVVAVKKSVFDVISYDTFWLSFTPDVPGSRFGQDQSVCPRIATSVLLKPRGCDELIRFCNTHLDHKGEVARLLGISQVLQYLTQFNEKFILTGDFNATPSSPVIAALNGTKHKGRPITEPTANVGGTFHGFGKREVPSKIDYIFTDADADPAEAYAVNYPPVNGVYVSDHHPIVAYVDI